VSPLVIIYHFQVSQNIQDEFRPASYKILHVFSSQSFLEDSYIDEKMTSFPDINPIDQSFLNLDDLKAFGLSLAEDLELEEARLISIQDYNIGIDGAKNSRDFNQIFGKFGEVIQNLQLKKKKSLFGRLFS